MWHRHCRLSLVLQFYFAHAGQPTVCPSHVQHDESLQEAHRASLLPCSVALPSQGPDPDKLTPGPGAYGSSSGGSARPLSAPTFALPARSPTSSPRCRQQQPLFARTAGRSAALSVGPGWSLPPNKSVSPGPGTYNLRGPMAAAAAAVAASAEKVLAAPKPAARAGVRSAWAAGVAAAAAGVEVTQGEAEAAAAAGFGCTSRRFGSDKTVAPGPGKPVL